MLKLIEKDENLKITPVALDDADANNIEDIAETPSVDTVKQACRDAVNALIQSAWDFIATNNSVLATLDVEYPDNNKDTIIELLNTVVDDTTISIGMLQKVLELVSNKTSELLIDGEKKAEEIINK